MPTRILRQPDEVFSAVFDVSGNALVLESVSAGAGVTSTFYQPNEVFSAVYDVTHAAVQSVTVVLSGTVGITDSWGAGPTKEVASLPASTQTASLPASHSGIIVHGTVKQANKYQPDEVLRGVFDVTANAFRVAKVLTGGGPIAGRRWQVDEVLNGAYDPVNHVFRVVSVSAGSGPTATRKQPNEVLSAIFDPVAGALQVEGI